MKCLEGLVQFQDSEAVSSEIMLGIPDVAVDIILAQYIVNNSTIADLGIYV